MIDVYVGGGRPTVAGGVRESVSVVHVVVPAHNEERHLAACLESALQSLAEARRHRVELTGDVTVVLDDCHDASAEIAETMSVRTVTCHARSVGVARHAGVLSAARGDRVAEYDVLILNTDADCVVPAGWVDEHVELSRDYDVVLGEVEPDPMSMSAELHAAWWERHPPGVGGLHGANLGIRYQAYRRAGGFPAVERREDALLVGSLREVGARITGGTRVRTSPRHDGRVEGGFATYMRQLALSLGEPTPSPAPGP